MHTTLLLSTFQRWFKKKRKKKKKIQEGKNTKEGFHFTPDEQTEPSRGLFVSIPRAVLMTSEISDESIKEVVTI